MLSVFRALCLSALLVSCAHAGPFGLEMGMSVNEVRKLAPLTANADRSIYTMHDVPVPNASFTMYKLFITPLFGLCKILAVTPVIRSNAEGADLRAAFDRVEKDLRAQYGAGKRIDTFKAGSAWEAPRQWMVGLAEEQQALNAYWYRAEDALLPDSLRAIKLEANALGEDRGYLALGYEFTNFGSCLAEDKDSDLARPR